MKVENTEREREKKRKVAGCLEARSVSSRVSAATAECTEETVEEVSLQLSVSHSVSLQEWSARSR